MNIKPIIVKSYLESLTEERELNSIFPMLLTSLGYDILSKPTENKGLQEYGKDVVAVGYDENKVKTRFYFELKGGKDRDITTQTLHKNDGIVESLREAKFKNFPSSYPSFTRLPIKVILVHNGVVKGNAREVFEGFIRTEFPEGGAFGFEQWDIEKLSTLFSTHLFGAYLLTDQPTTRLFNKVLINLNASGHVSRDFIVLVDSMLNKKKWEGYKTKLPRSWGMLFESLKLIAFIVYTEAREYNNMDIAKRYLTHLVLHYWHWILKNKLEDDRQVLGHFRQTLTFFYSVIEEFMERTLPIAVLPNGLSSETSGRYEQIGYTKRTFEYLNYLCWKLQAGAGLNPNADTATEVDTLIKVINANNVSFRPLVDINSVTIIDVLSILLSSANRASAINYFQSVLSYIVNGKEKYGRMPDAGNDYEIVIRYTLTGEKPVYYSDTTSPLLAVLVEYTAILDLEAEYLIIRDFAAKHEINLGIFTPHHGIGSVSLDLIENREDDLEEQLFSNPYLNDGYQHDISLFQGLFEELKFEDFKKTVAARKHEFTYHYRTDKAGFPYLRSLAHIYFKTPYFPDKWRSQLTR